jgi:type I restriction enzyme S subunit
MNNVPMGYKQTEMGAIPEDWLVDTLGNLTVLMTNGFVGTATRHYASNDNGILYIQGYNVEENSFNFHVIKFVTEEFHKAHMKSCLRCGDLLTVQTGDVGLTTIVPESLAGSNCHALIISRFDKKRVSPAFISYYLNSKPGRSRLKLIETGTTMKHLNVGDMLHFSVPIPPTKAEQEAIAEALRDADALIESLEQLIAKKRQIKQGAMQELLTGKQRLPGYSGGWVVNRFGEIAQPRKERINPSRTKPHDFCIELEHIGQSTGTLTGYTTTSDNSSLKSVFQNGDVLFGKLRAYLRKYWLANQPGVCSTEIWVLVAKCSVVSPEFLFHLVTMDRFIEVASTAYGTHMPRSDWHVVKNYEVILPPLEEQTVIAEIFSDMDAEIAALEAKLAKARQIKQGMMQELLTLVVIHKSEKSV